MTADERRAQLAIARSMRKRPGKGRSKFIDAIMKVAACGELKFVFRTPAEAERMGRHINGTIWYRNNLLPGYSPKVRMQLRGNTLKFWRVDPITPMFWEAQ